MIPILYNAAATTFENKGIGELVDAISCTCDMHESEYELTIEYPVDGVYYDQIVPRNIVYVKPNQTDVCQPFRVYRVGKTMNGKTTFYCRHISYDLTGVPVTPFTATGSTSFANQLQSHMTIGLPFVFGTNMGEPGTVEIKAPCSARSLLAGGDNTWQGKYGGELRFNGWHIDLMSEAGENRGVVFQYGVDIVDLQQEDNIAEVYTCILPYFQLQEDGETITVIGDVLDVNNQITYRRAKVVDVTEFIAESRPTKERVNAIGRQWMEENDITSPVVSLTLRYAQINQIVRLYDTVTVEFVKLGISETAKITRTVFDCLTERYNSIDVGDVRPKLSDDVHDASKLRKGLLPVERIKDGSIDGDKKLGGGSVSGKKVKKLSLTDENLADNSVTVNKIGDGAVSSVKIKDGAVTGNKVLDGAVSYAKFNHNLQVTWTDILAAQAVFAGVIYAEGSVSCSSFLLGGEQCSVGDLSYMNSIGQPATARVVKKVG